jgi:glucuronoarabinoxylan endo-1,4-beta-xylanase
VKNYSCSKAAASCFSGILLVLLILTGFGQTVRAQNITVNWNDVYQRIDGFGASSAGQGYWTSNQASMFFSTNSGTGYSYFGQEFTYNGIGLSLLRSQITPEGDTVEESIMQMAQALGAKVWSTPWTPPPEFKTDGTNAATFDGGNFNSASNEAYADQLAGYVADMQSEYGVNIYAVSVQNEPDVATDYPSCLWTAGQIDEFVPYLYNALADAGVGSTEIMLPEDEHWETTYYQATMTDPTAAPEVGIIACHNYDGSPPTGTPDALSKYDNTNAALWETEVSTYDDTYDPSITNALYWAGRIHLFMTSAQANAFHYWWLISQNNDNEGLASDLGVPALRMYALGNFSRFVRPGFYRIGVTNNTVISISAYKDPNSGNFAIVAINSSVHNVTQNYHLANFNAGSVTPWITSATFSLVNQTPVAVVNSVFSYSLPSNSIVTFTGQAYLPPSSITITNAVLNSNGFVLTWNSVAGATYSVLETNALPGSPANWPVLVTGYPAGGAAAGSLSYTDTTASVSATANFYQVSSP